VRLRFTYHAQSQALARHIHESRVADTIRSHDSAEQTAGGAVLFRKGYADGTLEAICARGKRKNEYLVLTMYYL